MHTTKHTMALTSNSTPSNHFERECLEIHTSWNRPGQLGVALARRTAAERQQIKERYRAMYGTDLIERLRDDDRGGPVRAALYLWMLEPHERDAVVAREALEHRSSSGEPDYRALVEIYARRKSTQLFFTKQAYLTMFKAHLDHDLASESSHPYQRMLGALATSQRPHHEEVSQHIAKCDAKKLYGAINSGGGGGGIDEATILEVFSKRSIPQLQLAFFSYKQIYGHDFTRELKKESRGEFEEPLRVVVQCMCDPFDYYSEMVFGNLKGGMTVKRVLTRVMMGGAETGMGNVNAAFEKRYGTKIQDAVRENIADGDYRDFLLALIN